MSVLKALTFPQSPNFYLQSGWDGNGDSSGEPSPGGGRKQEGGRAKWAGDSPGEQAER